MSINEQTREVLLSCMNLPITAFEKGVNLKLKPLKVVVKGIRFTRQGLVVSLRHEDTYIQSFDVSL